MAKPLNQLSGMPQMSAAFDGWMSRLNLYVVEQKISSGFLVNFERLVKVQGTWQPLDPEQIKVKPEGQRSWEWVDLHVKGSALLFKTDDRVLKDGLRYKVMAVKNYTANGFSEYHLIRDYDDEMNPSPVPPGVVTDLGAIVTYLGQPVTNAASM